MTAQFDALAHWRRNAATQAVAALTGRETNQVARQLYSAAGAEIALRAAVNPASTDGWGGELAHERVGLFLQSLRPTSAAAKIFARAPRFDLSGARALVLPRIASAFPEPAWVDENEPIPAHSGTLDTVNLDSTHKLAMIAGLSHELRNLSAQNAEELVGTLMKEAASRALDVALFSTAAKTSVRPAGLLNSVTPITAATGGGIDAVAKDIRALVAAIHAGGAGSGIVIVASPADAVVLRLYSKGDLEIPIIVGPSLDQGTVVALDTGALACAFGDAPEVDISASALIHWDDNAEHIATEGEPNAVAAPVRSGFQTATYALRLILSADWVVRQPGAVQYVTGAAW